MKKETISKSKVIGVKVSDDLYRVFEAAAGDKKKIPEFLRNSGFVCAEMSLENKEILELVSEREKIKAQKTIHTLIKESKESVLNTLTEIYNKLSLENKKAQKMLEEFNYVYLYHTPEVPASRKAEAKKSALARLQMVLARVKEKIKPKK